MLSAAALKEQINVFDESFGSSIVDGTALEMDGKAWSTRNQLAQEHP